MKVEAGVIITTAYENYALKAFRVNSIDYLLKPIDSESFVNAVEKFKKNRTNSPFNKETITKLVNSSKVYKQRFTVKVGNHIIVIDINDIAYIYSENKSTYFVTRDKRKFLSDLSLETLEDQLNPSLFFKLSRSCIASVFSIESISKHFNSRLKIKLTPNLVEDILVSRAKVPSFLNWLEGIESE